MAPSRSKGIRCARSTRSADTVLIRDPITCVELTLPSMSASIIQSWRSRQPPDDPRIIRNLLRPQDNPFAAPRHIGVDFVEHRRTQRERRRRSESACPISAAGSFRPESLPCRKSAPQTDLPPAQTELRRNVPHARLQWQQVRRHPSFLHFPAQKLQDMSGNLF